jgi:hypothetical protein
MNTVVAASFFDSPWVLPIIVLLGALTNWLMKRRQGNQAENQPSGDDPVPPSKTPERLQRPLDLQEVLRQLLGGEAPPRAPQPPPIPPVMRDAQPAEVWPDEEQFQPEQAWMDEAQETHEAARPPAIQTAPPSRPHPALAGANANRIKNSEPNEEAVRRFEQLNEQGRHPATVVNTGRGRRSRTGVRAVALLRDSRTVRQAFIASLVFGPPKAFET